ncbi:MAG: hypothetical protein WCV70_01905 [Patescibacteria group bacterium]|jgi:hypothetical protein
MRKLLLALTFIIIILVSGYYYYLPKVRWQKAVEASGTYSYPIGLTNTKEIQCSLSCCTAAGCRCCIGTGSTLCATITNEATCPTKSEINGTMAGGSGTMALFSKTQTSMAGYKPGDSIIAAGMTMTEMDNGVLATPGGCSGCGMSKADSNLLDRIVKVADYIIAGFRDKIK